MKKLTILFSTLLLSCSDFVQYHTVQYSDGSKELVLIDDVLYEKSDTVTVSYSATGAKKIVDGLVYHGVVNDSFYSDNKVIHVSIVYRRAIVIE